MKAHLSFMSPEWNQPVLWCVFHHCTTQIQRGASQYGALLCLYPAIFCFDVLLNSSSFCYSQQAHIGFFLQFPICAFLASILYIALQLAFLTSSKLIFMMMLITIIICNFKFRLTSVLTGSFPLPILFWVLFPSVRACSMFISSQSALYLHHLFHLFFL